MTSKLLAGAALTVLAGLPQFAAVEAADLRPVYKAPPVTAPYSVYNWSGFYVGVNGGAIWGGGDTDFLIGGTVGYNWQGYNSPWVFGLEGDIGFVTGGPHDYFATIRGRIGYAFDRWMPYVTGGAAFTDGNGSSVGGTIGVGVEYAFTSNVSAKVEYLWAGFDGHDDNIFRGGVNIKFRP